MSRAEGSRGFSLAELLVALGVASALAIAGVTATATALRVLLGAGARLEATDLAWLAEESFMFAVRRAGFDPRATGIDAIAEATSARLALHADLDGDGTVDASSAEATTFACDVPGRRLSRIVGAQSLPLASTVVACAFIYRDADGTALVPPPSGLDAAARRRVRRITLDAAVEPADGGPPARATMAVALRGEP